MHKISRSGTQVLLYHWNKVQVPKMLCMYIHSDKEIMEEYGWNFKCL